MLARRTVPYQLSGTRVKFINVLINNVYLLHDNATICYIYQQPTQNENKTEIKTTTRRTIEQTSWLYEDDNRELLSAMFYCPTESIKTNTCSNSQMTNSGEVMTPRAPELSSLLRRFLNYAGKLQRFQLATARTRVESKWPIDAMILLFSTFSKIIQKGWLILSVKELCL